MQYNIRSVICDSCSEPALEFDNYTIGPDVLEGRVQCCESCSVLGRISFDDERGRLDFLPLSHNEVAMQDECTLIDAYLKSQKKIDELYEEVSMLLRGVK